MKFSTHANTPLLHLSTLILLDTKTYFDNGVKRFFSVLCAGWKSLNTSGVFTLASNVE